MVELSRYLRISAAFSTLTVLHGRKVAVASTRLKLHRTKPLCVLHSASAANVLQRRAFGAVSEQVTVVRTPSIYSVSLSSVRLSVRASTPEAEPIATTGRLYRTRRQSGSDDKVTRSRVFGAHTRVYTSGAFRT